MKVTISKNYSQARAEAYPSMLEFVEATTEKDRGDDTKWKAYMEKIAQVRAKYPKPKA